jgi:hypothetical protein
VFVFDQLSVIKVSTRVPSVFLENRVENRHTLNLNCTYNKQNVNNLSLCRSTFINIMCSIN